MKRNKRFLVIIVILSSIIGLFLFARVQGGDFLSELGPLIAAYRSIQNEYIEKVEPSQLMQGAIKGMIESLEDPYSHWMNAEVYEEMKQEKEGEFGGVGIQITIEDNFLTIISPLEGSPASKVGLEPRDRIIKINEESAEKITLTEAMRKLRGEPGTEVKMTIQRRQEKNPLEFTITRAIIKFPNIKEKTFKENIGYIKIVGFTNENTAEDLREALIRLKTMQVEALILDLRYNPGGLLTQAVEVADEFLSSGVIVSIKGRDSSQNQVYSAHQQGEGQNIPLIILINQGSASASEIVAGAIKENKRGILLGEKTFGKGTVQAIIPINKEGAITLTTAKYYTPSEISIEGEGIEPDIKVEAFKPTEEEKEILVKLKESKLIEEFLIQYPYWEQANLTSLRSELEEEGITVEKEFLQRFLRQEDENKDNDILNDPQLLEAIEILGN
ncbi:peptidase S41 [Candidatus Aerophobetes bacterium Ae_b3a]|nr:MAG: peptidase S41 [Candidatus Aerophobetes bacterium Ae_b3a]